MIAGLRIDHVIDLQVIDIFGGVGHQDKFYAIKLLGGVKHAFEHIVEREIRTDLSLIEIELLLLDLVGIIIVIVRSDLESAAVGVDISLHVGDLLMAAVHGRLKHLHKQLRCRLRSFCHHPRSHHLCERIEAHQFRLFIAELHDLAYYRQVGILSIRSEVSISFIDRLAQAA